MTFLEAVNRMLRLATIIQQDDDDITSFAQTQHSATISLAKQAIQHVTNDLVSDTFLFPESVRAEITTAIGTRTYSLAADFVRFEDKSPWFQKLEGATGSDATGNFLAEYTGKEDALKKEVPAYTSQQGTPQWYYFTNDQEIGIYPVPDSVDIWRYDYQKDVMPEVESDSLPVQSEQMAYAYVDMAARVFSFLFARQPIEGFDRDVIYNRAKSALLTLQRKRPPTDRYGFRYQ